MDEAVILVGTETGTAEDIADELADALDGAGVEVEIMDLEDAETSVLDGGRAVVVCTATHGDGELPDNSFEFYEKLEKERPDLSDLPFAVCGLGDNSYEDCWEAGKIWSRLLGGLGAKEVIVRYEMDGFPNEENVEGAREWVEQAAERFAGLVEERG